MKKFIYITAYCCLFFIVSCSDMNDLHEIYLENGETTYIGRVDSVHEFSGRERALLRYWITDPRAKYLMLYWNQFEDSLKVEIPPHQPEEYQDIIIGENGSQIAEGDYTFFFYSYDNKGYRSVKYEKTVKVYGNKYQQALSARSIKTAVPNTGEKKLTLTWGGSSSIDEIGVEVFYTKADGIVASITFNVEVLAKATVVENIDLTKEVSYQTLYKPTSTAIDTFRTPKSVINF